MLQGTARRAAGVTVQWYGMVWLLTLCQTIQRTTITEMKVEVTWAAHLNCLRGCHDCMPAEQADVLFFK